VDLPGRQLERGALLFADAQNRGQDSRIAPPMKNCEHEQRLFVGSVNEQIIAHDVKADLAGSQVGSNMTHMRERYLRFESLRRYRQESGQRLLRYLSRRIPKVRLNLCRRRGGRQIRSSPGSTVTTLGPELLERLFAVYRSHPAAANVIVTVVEHSTQSSQLDQVSRHGVFDQFVWLSAALLGKFLQAYLSFGFKMHDHGNECKDGRPAKSKQLHQRSVPRLTIRNSRLHDPRL